MTKWVLIALVILMGEMMTAAAPIYYPKIIGINGTVIAAPLSVAMVSFTERSFVPGQHRLGDFVLTLANTRKHKYLRSIYNTLAPRQRVEIYENRDLMGDPVFAGVLIRQTRDTRGNRQWRGNSYEDWLDRRHVPQYHQVSGNAMTVLQEYLSTHNSIFKDIFTNLDNWTVSGSNAAGYTATGGVLQRAGDADNPMAPDSYADSDTTFTAANWDDVKISFDAKTDVPGSGSTPYVEIQGPWVDSSTDRFRLQIWAKPYADDGYYIYIEEGGTGAVNTWNRTMLLTQGQWMRVAVHVSMPTSTTRRIVVMINGLEAIDVTQTNATRHSGEVRIWMNGTDAIKSYMDNFIFAPKTAVLTAGNIDTTSDTIDQQFNGDSYLSIIEWICDMQGWTYRIRPKAGAGNDLFDAGAVLRP